MNKLRQKKNKGFTLVELIVAIVLGAFISVMSTLIIVNGMGQIKAIKQEERLHSDTIYIHNKLEYLIRRAKDIDVTSDIATNDTLTLTMPDTSSRIIKVISTNEITLSDGATTNVINSQKVEADSIFFEEIGKSIRITLVLTSGINPESTLSSRTVVTTRN